jgi:AcrR family transcriptional regulator
MPGKEAEFEMRITEKLITNAIMDLLRERPYNKITVTDIVKRCDINRNTFYYHYADIPDLIQHLLRDRTRQLCHTERHFRRPLTFVFYLVLVADKYKKILNNLYHSEMQPYLEDVMMTVCAHFANRYIHQSMQEAPLSREDSKLLIRYWSAIINGMFSDWLKHNMNYELPKVVKRICVLTAARKTLTTL